MWRAPWLPVDRVGRRTLLLPALGAMALAVLLLHPLKYVGDPMDSTQTEFIWTEPTPAKSFRQGGGALRFPPAFLGLFSAYFPLDFLWENQSAQFSRGSILALKKTTPPWLVFLGLGSPLAPFSNQGLCGLLNRTFPLAVSSKLKPHFHFFAPMNRFCAITDSVRKFPLRCPLLICIFFLVNSSIFSENSY